MDEALGPPIHLPKRPLLMARLARLGFQPALGLVRSRFAGERGRALLVGMAAHAPLPLDRAPSAAFGIMLALAGHGVGWPVVRGGSQSIADGLASILLELGGRIETGSRVRSVDSLPRADATLLDLTPRQVLAVAGHRLPNRYRRQLGRYRYGPGVFKLDWALAEPIPWTAAECRRAGAVIGCRRGADGLSYRLDGT